MAGRLEDRLRDPLVWTDVLQLVKTVAAAVIAWLLAVEVFSLPQSFLAPWAALLTVHATVYRTLTRGIQQAAAAVVGVLLAFAVTPILGVSWASLALVLLAGLAVGAIGPMRAESTTAAATALVVLLTGSATTARCCLRGWPTRSSASRSVSPSTSLSGRRCAIVVPRAASMTSTTASARCSPTWPAGFKATLPPSRTVGWSTRAS